MNNCKIVFPFIGANVGGSHLSTMALMEGLVQHDPECCVMLAPAGTTLEKAATGKGLPFVPAGEPPAADFYSNLYNLKRVIARARLLKSIQGDKRLIVHCNDMPALLAWVLPTKLARGMLVYHHRSFNTMTPKVRATVRAADRIVAISEFTKSNLPPRDQPRVHTLTNACLLDFSFDLADASKALRAELNLTDDKILIGFVANFFRRKRPYFFLDVAKELVQRSSAYHFAVFGRNGDMKEEDLIAYTERLGISSHVSFLGFRLPPERNIASVDALLIPAENEPWGRTLLEAAVAGTPYIATDSGGHREVWELSGGGTLLPFEATPAQFADAVTTEISIDHRRPPRALRQELLDRVAVGPYLEKIQRVYAETPAG